MIEPISDSPDIARVLLTGYPPKIVVKREQILDPYPWENTERYYASLEHILWGAERSEDEIV